MIPLRADDPIVILTGAGISAESGIQTFRGSDGLWCGHRIEDVATPEGFARNPAVVHEFYNMRRRQLLAPEIAPNTAHKALARLQQSRKAPVMLVTQNIDNLHERGGSTDVVHMHGELLKLFCVFCNSRGEITTDLSTADPCSSCGRAGGLRPDIVWFGEMPYDMDRIYEYIKDCALFISIGTSGNVYPAAGFVATARAHGAHCMELNLEPSLTANAFNDHIFGPASETVPALVDRLLT